MKKFSNVFVLMLVAAMLLPACGTSTDAAPDCRSTAIFCVGMVTNLGKLDDNSFNQSAWAGVEQARKNLGSIGEHIVTTDTKDYDKNISTFGESGYDVIVTVGFALGKATVKAASAYPNTKFIGVDQNQAQDTDQPIPENLVRLVFAEDQAGFLVGALAAQMSTSRKIGAVCSTDEVASIWRYCEGFRAGAAYIDPSVEVTVTYHTDITFDEAFFDPVWGAATAKSMMDAGIDVIMGAGGETGNGAINAAAKQDVYALGFDDDKYYSLPEVRKMLLSSAMKVITPGVFNLIKAAKEGQFPGGTNFVGMIGYAPFHDQASNVPPDVKDTMKEIEKGLRDGSILTNVEPEKP